MNSKLKYSIITLLAVFIIIQLIPVDRENPQTASEGELQAPQEVKSILKNSCYDCHSNNTNWPYYSYVAPFSWLIARDVEKGRKDLNFSNWNNQPPDKIEKMKEEIVEEIEVDEMPLPIYVIVHSDAELSDDQKTIIKNWANSDQEDEKPDDL